MQCRSTRGQALVSARPAAAHCIAGDRMSESNGGGAGAAVIFAVLGLVMIAALGAMAVGVAPPRVATAVAGVAALALLWKGYRAYRTVEGATQQAYSVGQAFAASVAVQSSLDVGRVLRTAAEAAGRLSRHTSASLLFMVDDTERAGVKSSWGIDPPIQADERLQTLDIPVTEVLKTRKMAIVSFPSDGMRTAPHGLSGFRSACILPLQGKGGMVGALMLLSHKKGSAFRRELPILEYFASQTALAIDNARLYQQVQDLFISAIKALADAVDAKDAYTHGHSQDIAELVTMVARELKLPPREEEKVRLAGLLHDVGKIGIPDAILHKPGKLDPSERAIMMTHVTLGASIIDKPGPLQDLVTIVRHHHERYDGRGYPDGLRGSEIPIGSAILAAADAFDAMTSHRSYHAARPIDAALAELTRHSGTQFHPEVVKMLERIVHRERQADSIWYKNLEARIQNNTEGQHSNSPYAIPSHGVGTMWRLTQEIRHVEDLSALLGRIAHATADGAGTRECAVLLLDEEEQSLSVEAVVDSKLETGTLFARNRSPLWRAIEQRAAQRSEDGRTIYAPMFCGSRAVGVLQATGPALGEPAVHLLSVLADTVAPAVQAMLLRARSERLSTSDPLTGLLNRTALVDRLREETTRHKRYGASFTLVLADIERLGEFNARYGYEAGDDLMRRTAEILSSRVRPVDLAARLHGGTFAILMPDLGPKEAERAIQQLQQMYRERQITIQGRFMPAEPLAWSLASCPRDGAEPDALLAQAERRLRYRRRHAHH